MGEGELWEAYKKKFQEMFGADPPTTKQIKLQEKFPEFVVNYHETVGKHLIVPLSLAFIFNLTLLFIAYVSAYMVTEKTDDIMAKENRNDMFFWTSVGICFLNFLSTLVNFYTSAEEALSYDEDFSKKLVDIDD